MSPIASSAARMVRAAAPLRVAAVRQYSAAAGGSFASAPAGFHSTKKLVILSGVGFAVGIDVTCAYFYLSQKKETTA
ncbi:hypothetical protein BGX24_004702 [Mortierella sp. AD032]|nr:hypothetical protein BGX24_004702 [Mortierella sp. AD032]